jgi:hypothetical protein
LGKLGVTFPEIQYSVKKEILVRKVFFLSTLIYQATLMPYNSNCHCQVNFFDLAGTPTQLAELEAPNIFHSIDALLNEMPKKLVN